MRSNFSAASLPILLSADAKELPSPTFPSLLLLSFAAEQQRIEAPPLLIRSRGGKSEGKRERGGNEKAKEKASRETKLAFNLRHRLFLYEKTFKGKTELTFLY